MKGISEHIKTLLTVFFVLLLGILSALRLMKIQVVGDNEIISSAPDNPGAFTYSEPITATRGEIVDYFGAPIISNKTGYSAVLKKAFFPDDDKDGNRVLIEAYNILKSHGYTVKDELPISDTTPYVFKPNSDDDSANLKKLINLNVYATAENCIDKLVDDYKISSDYSDAEKRIIAGMRYDLALHEFSYSAPFLLAENIDSDTITELKEKSIVLRGIDITESPIRTISNGKIIPHEIGTVGPIYAEEYEALKKKGYALNDVVGKSGIESAMENYLRGSNGAEDISVLNGSVVSQKITTKPEIGKTVKLTVDSQFQTNLQNILTGFINNFPSFNSNANLKNVKCGALVVLDAKTGAVRGMATAPTYDLNDYKSNYDAILNGANTPLIDRATDGLYLPGSTFKTITATAGLNEGLVNGDTTFYCNKDYTFYDITVHCTGTHGTIAISRALEVSCNVYFYELSRLLTIDGITKYAKLYGLGESTGLETGDAEGYLATPEEYESRGEQWYVGQVLQAGIGNSECGVTPLQMACVANTIANKGVRYKPYLVDGLYQYGTDNCISKTQPTVAQKINLNYDYVYDYINQGMIGASHNVPEKYSLSDLGFDVAIKTGTPQVATRVQDSFFIGYAPADNPEIAFAGVIEGGDYSKYMIRDIILAYQQCYGLNGVKGNSAALNYSASSADNSSSVDTDVLQPISTTNSTQR